MSFYWIMHIIGFLLTSVLYFARAERFGITKAKAIAFSAILGGVGFFGAKVMYIFLHAQSNLNRGIDFGGISILGTVLIGPLAAICFHKFGKMTVGQLADYCAPALMLYLMCVRVGCIYAGCCGGIQVGTYQVPTQAIEAIFDSMLFVYLLYCENENRLRNKAYPLLMVTYGGVRFILEFVRLNQRVFYFFTCEHFIALLCLGIGLLWLLREKRKSFLLACDEKKGR